MTRPEVPLNSAQILLLLQQLTSDNQEFVDPAYGSGLGDNNLNRLTLARAQASTVRPELATAILASLGLEVSGGSVEQLTSIINQTQRILIDSRSHY